MWLSQLLERNRQCHGDRLAIVDGDRQVTWAELYERVLHVTGVFTRFGLRHGDRVAVVSRDRLEVLETYFALARLGAVTVPVNHGLTAVEIAEIVRQARPTAAVGEAEILRGGICPGVPALAFDDEQYTRPAPLPEIDTAPDVRAEDLAAILFTSGTAVEPRGVVVDHRSMKATALGWSALARPGEDVVLLNCGPLFHGGMMASLAYLVSGGTLVVLPTFTPSGALRCIERFGVTHVWLVPEMLRFLLSTIDLGRADLASLREVVYAAGPMPVEMYVGARAQLGCEVRQVYALPEAGGPFATLAPAEHFAVHDADGWPESIPVGRVIPGMSVRVVDDEGRESPTGQVGEVCLRGDGVMRGYWNDPQATADILRDGWLHTGDVARMDRHGFLHLVDRRKEMVVRDGFDVYPAELERVLRGHPAVADAAVVGVRERDHGEVPVAFVVRRQGEAATSRDLLDFLASAVAPYKQPRELHFADALPRGPAGKVLKRVLRERATRGV